MTEQLAGTGHGPDAWMMLGKAAAIFLSSFVLEDAAAIGAGLLLAAGTVNWPVAFTACWLGIWLGDAGLYALARFGGRSWFERSGMKRHAARVARSEAWFARRGGWILVLSRCVPGARLPTYLAAGFLRVPLPRFLLITGAAALVWTSLILWVTGLVGKPLFHALSAYRQGCFIALGVVVVVAVVIQLIRLAPARQRANPRIAKWTRWEFWPPWLFYPPVVLNGLWLAVKYRGASLPALANPGIRNGGIIGESKMVTLRQLMATSPEFTAPAALIEGQTIAERLASLQRAPTEFLSGGPCVLKPDVGQRGVGIKVVRTSAQAEAYFRQTGAPLIAQAYVPGPLEAGIFYYRFPHEPHGRIFAITEKIFPVVVGDGLTTVAELIRKDDRAAIIAEIYLSRFSGREDFVPAVGQEVRLVEAGNHAQGCIFQDGQHLWTPELEARIDEISRRVEGFFIGRYDLRYTSHDELRAGRNFQIIELNGATSEATSIYDARNSLWSAYRTLFRQWDLVFAIGAANRQRGTAPVRVRDVWNEWRAYQRLAASYPPAD